MSQKVDGLTFYVNLVAVAASKAFAKGTLHLAPASQGLDTKSSPASFCLGEFASPGGEPIKIYMGSQVVHPLDKQGNSNMHKWICPFFMVGLSKPSEQQGKKGDISMEVQWVSKSVNTRKVHIPTLVNSVALKPGDLLKWSKSVDGPLYMGEEHPPMKKQRTN